MERKRACLIVLGCLALYIAIGVTSFHRNSPAPSAATAVQSRMPEGSMAASSPLSEPGRSRIAEPDLPPIPENKEIEIASQPTGKPPVQAGTEQNRPRPNQPPRPLPVARAKNRARILWLVKLWPWSASMPQPNSIGRPPSMIRRFLTKSARTSLRISTRRALAIPATRLRRTSAHREPSSDH